MIDPLITKWSNVSVGERDMTRRISNFLWLLGLRVIVAGAASERRLRREAARKPLMARPRHL